MYREQRNTVNTILRNELIAMDKVYTLLSSHLIRTNTQTTFGNTTFRDTISGVGDTMTGILWEEIFSDPSLNMPAMTRSSSFRNRRAPRQQRMQRSRPQRRTNRITSTLMPATLRIGPLFNTSIPSTTQIQNATTTHKYMDLSTNNILCPITRTEFVGDDLILKLNRCGHIFKKEALEEWFTRKSTCPVCRDNILTRPTNPPPYPPPPPPSTTYH